MKLIQRQTLMVHCRKAVTYLFQKLQIGFKLIIKLILQFNILCINGTVIVNFRIYKNMIIFK